MVVWRWIWPLGLAVLLTAWLGPLLAPALPPEVHILGVWEPGAAEVEVRVDRPGANVVLVLVSGNPVTWKLRPGLGTAVARVVLGGEGAERSSVLGDVGAAPDHLDLPLAWATDGPQFHTLSLVAPKLLAAPVASFQGAYTAPPEGFAITAARDANPALQPDYLKDQVVDPKILPAAFQAILAGTKPVPEPVTFDRQGFHLTAPDGKVTDYPIPPEIPEVRFTGGAARDPVTGKLYGASTAGPGELVVLDPATEGWSVASSLHEAQPGGLIFDPEGQRLVIVASEDGSDGKGLLLYYGRDGTKHKTHLVLAGFAGLDDVMGTNSGANGLIPLAVAEGKILLMAQSGWHARHQYNDGTEGVTRLYSVDMTTGQGDLVAWSEPRADGALPPWAD